MTSLLPPVLRYIRKFEWEEYWTRGDSLAPPKFIRATPAPIEDQVREWVDESGSLINSVTTPQIATEPTPETVDGSPVTCRRLMVMVTYTPPTENEIDVIRSQPTERMEAVPPTAVTSDTPSTGSQSPKAGADPPG